MKIGTATISDKLLFIKKLFSINKDKYLKVRKQKCAGTQCPGGCCPNQNWYCCPDNIHCASSAEYCHSTNIAEKLIGMAAPKRFKREVKQDCQGTECPGGCCPQANYFCCADGMFCAPSADFCP